MKIREFQDEDERNYEDNENFNNFDEKKNFDEMNNGFHEERELKSAPNKGKKKARLLSFHVHELSDESVNSSKLKDKAKEAAKHYIKVLRKKLEKNNSRNVIELFEILKVHMIFFFLRKKEYFFFKKKAC